MAHRFHQPIEMVRMRWGGGLTGMGRIEKGRSVTRHWNNGEEGVGEALSEVKGE
jgi:hypothetical protein